MANSNMKIVHETEAQRQHVRVKIPALLELDNAEKLEVKELSAGGLGFDAALNVFKVGQVKNGLLRFNLDGIFLSLQVSLQIKHIDPSTGRVGCVFTELGMAEVNSLRHIITSFIAGELITTGDVISTLKRDNFTKSRNNGFKPDQQTNKNLIKAAVGSIAAFAAGLAALFFVLNTLYNLYFVSVADSAFVDSDRIVLALPHDGNVTALRSTGSLVAEGEPIATLSSSVVDFIGKNIDPNTIETKKLKEMLSTELQTSITSPCDCIIAKQLIANGQFGNKGYEAFLLIPSKMQPFITARFQNKHFEHLSIGAIVTIQLAGEKNVIKGAISGVEVDSKKFDEIIVNITPEKAIDITLINHPVHVALAKHFNNGFFDSTTHQGKTEI